jgi:formylglycine-generating enzyme required for sulfatase activity
MAFTHVFLAHSSQDEETASRILEYFEREGIKCWIAPRDIPLGEQWAEAILDAIEDASAMLLVFSESANDSPQVLREVERAVDKRVPIYPVKIEEVDPTRAMEYYLSSHQWKEVFWGDLERNLARLIPTIKRNLGLTEGQPHRRSDKVVPRERDLYGWGKKTRSEARPGRTGKALRRLAYVLLPMIAAAVVLALVWPNGRGGPARPAPVDTTGVSRQPIQDRPAAGDLSDGPVEGMTFSFIPSGTFLMGSPESEPGRDGDEGPTRHVEIDDFELMTTEVTQEMWESVTGQSPSYHAMEGCPVENVSWIDCMAYIDSLNSMDSSHVYRLPSEAEWEYACRAGTQTPYYWGEDSTTVEMAGHCWYMANSNGRTHPVGQKAANPWGLYDMVGNVLEWCWDHYAPGYENAPADGEPLLSDDAGSARVVRGGSARNSPAGCRSASRSSYAQTGSSPGIGFRVAREKRD